MCACAYEYVCVCYKTNGHAQTVKQFIFEILDVGRIVVEPFNWAAISIFYLN